MSKEFEELPQKRYITVSDVAKYMSIGRSTIYEMINRGEIPATRIGRRVLIHRKHFLAFLEENTVKIQQK